MGFITYDPRVDVLYVRLRRADPSERLRTRRLDGLRAFSVTPDGEIVGVEFLSPSREGVNLEDIPMADEIAETLAALAGFHVHSGGESWLTVARRRLRMTQEQLAQELGVAPTTVARWERGEREISTPNMLRLALQTLRAQREPGPGDVPGVIPEDLQRELATDPDDPRHIEAVARLRRLLAARHEAASTALASNQQDA